MLSGDFFALGLFLGLVAQIVAGPTVYVRNDQDKFLPDLLPVSSTVIPLSIYRVSYDVSVSDSAKQVDYEDPAKLLTVNNKKKYQPDKTAAKIKRVSKEEFEKRKLET